LQNPSRVFIVIPNLFRDLLPADRFVFTNKGDAETSSA